MIQRCTNPKHEAYDDYGGRGITVYEPWLNSFLDFFNYMGLKPDPSLEIDRIDNDGNYEPGNVHWTTQLQNAQKKRNSRFIEFNGKTQSLAQWAMDFAIARSRLRSRIKNLGEAVAMELSEKEYLKLQAIAPSQGSIGPRDDELEHNLREDEYDDD
jgi:hypothetical protein